MENKPKKINSILGAAIEILRKMPGKNTKITITPNKIVNDQGELKDGFIVESPDVSEKYVVRDPNKK